MLFPFPIELFPFPFPSVAQSYSHSMHTSTAGMLLIAAKLIGYRCDERHKCCFCHEYVPHSECADSVCRCKAGYYSNRIGNVCIPRKSVLCRCPGRCLSCICWMFSIVVAVVFTTAVAARQRCCFPYYQMHAKYLT